MKKYLKHDRSSSILFLLLAACLCVTIVFCCFINPDVAYATEENNPSNSDLNAICKDFTDDEFLHGEEKIEANAIALYESYVDNHFEISNKTNSNSTLVDEWILKIVPYQLFERQVENYLYVGETYGFYVNYNSTENNFLIFLIIHNEYDGVSGQYTREIRPLYYERYTYNATAGTASLLYKNTNDFQYYEKYSNIKTLYIKDVAFTGSLYNENHLNQFEEGYIDNEDYGAYLFGNHYKFKGVSTQSGKMKFVSETLITAMGYIPLLGGLIHVGDVLNIADFEQSCFEEGVGAKNDFRGEITNENDYGFKFDQAFADEQISEYGHLLKDGVAILETSNTKDAVLFGIRNGAYVYDTFFLAYRNQDTRWNTRFCGKIRLDIVEEIYSADDSTVQDVATNVESEDYVKRFDNNEKTILTEGEDQSLYILADASNKIRFEAPISGIYTVQTTGSTSNKIISDRGEITDVDNNINQKLVIHLTKNEVYDFSVKKKPSINTNLLGIVITFTPSQIGVGESSQITLQAGAVNYFEFTATHKATPFDFEITFAQDEASEQEGEMSLQFAYNKYNNYLPNIFTGSTVYGSRLFELPGKYYLIVTNTSDEAKTVSVSLSEISDIALHANIEENIMDTKVYKFSPPMTMDIVINFESYAPILLNVYDVNYNLMAWTSDSEDNALAFTANAGSNYYLVFSNYYYTTHTMDVSIEITAYGLNIGHNEMTKLTNVILAEFNTKDTDCTYKIESSVNLVIYNNMLQTISLNSDHECMLNANSKYYISISGAAQSFTVDIDVISTTETSGVIPESGFVLIKYVPTRSAIYNVSGIENVEWFNEYLYQHNAYLYQGVTYYLKVEGTAGDAYDVSIQRNANRINVNTGVTLSAGLYWFNITQSGSYTIWVSSAISVTTAITLSDGNGTVLVDNLPITNSSYQITLEADEVYYLDLSIYDGSKATVRILAN